MWGDVVRATTSGISAATAPRRKIDDASGMRGAIGSVRGGSAEVAASAARVSKRSGGAAALATEWTSARLVFRPPARRANTGTDARGVGPCVEKAGGLVAVHPVRPRAIILVALSCRIGTAASIGITARVIGEDASFVAVPVWLDKEIATRFGCGDWPLLLAGCVSSRSPVVAPSVRNTWGSSATVWIAGDECAMAASVILISSIERCIALRSSWT